jgi:hypothetical protein
MTVRAENADLAEWPSAFMERSASESTFCCWLLLVDPRLLTSCERAAGSLAFVLVPMPAPWLTPQLWLPPLGCCLACPIAASSCSTRGRLAALPLGRMLLPTPSDKAAVAAGPGLPLPANWGRAGGAPCCCRRVGRALCSSAPLRGAPCDLRRPSSPELARHSPSKAAAASSSSCGLACGFASSCAAAAVGAVPSWAC